MDFDSQIKLEHLLFKERRCRSCGESKDLISEYYLYRKSKPHLPSSYSYECKDCASERVTVTRKEKNNIPDIPYNPVPRFGPDIYPDW
jgi:hypothetical protein